MRKFVLIPDSFKGTMSSAEICDVMKEQLENRFPDCQVVSIPVADGGEGSVESFLAAMGGEMVRCRVMGPYMQEMEAFYGLVENGQTAVVEMAACAGLPLVGDRMDPSATTTYGVGQLIAHAVERGAKKVIVGLGGSATNDGGCGAACGAGAVFRNKAGEVFVPTGATLGQIAEIDSSAVKKLMAGVEVVAMCDVDNPMYGPMGAAAIYGPQKGADQAMIAQLDKGVIHLAEVMKQALGQDLAEAPGSGAAGAMGAGMVAFFGAVLRPGIQVVLDTVHFEDVIRDADMIFTGEGKIDSQSLRGKVVIGVARRAKPLGVPVFAVVGDIGDDVGAAYDEGVSGIFSINRVAVDFAKAKPRSRSDLALTMDNLARVMQLFWKR